MIIHDCTGFRVIIPNMARTGEILKHHLQWITKERLIIVWLLWGYVGSYFTHLGYAYYVILCLYIYSSTSMLFIRCFQFETQITNSYLAPYNHIRQHHDSSHFEGQCSPMVSSQSLSWWIFQLCSLAFDRCIKEKINKTIDRLPKDS